MAFCQHQQGLEHCNDQMNELGSSPPEVEMGLQPWLKVFSLIKELEPEAPISNKRVPIEEWLKL